MRLDDETIELVCERGERVAELVEMMQRTALDHREPDTDRMVEILRLAALIHERAAKIKELVSERVAA